MSPDKMSRTECRGQNVMGTKCHWTKCRGQKAVDKMSWSKCRGQNVVDKMPWTKMPWTICCGQNIVEKMSRTEGRGQYVVDYTMFVITSRLTESRCIVTAHGMDISWSRNYATTQHPLRILVTSGALLNALLHYISLQLLKLRWRNLNYHVKQAL